MEKSGKYVPAAGPADRLLVQASLGLFEQLTSGLESTTSHIEVYATMDALRVELGDLRNRGQRRRRPAR